MDYPNDQAPGAPVRSGIPEHGRVPKYYAVKAQIALLVDEQGEGAAIPTERDLAERFEVARETVRQALRELVLESKLRRQGRGTVVAGPKLEQPLSLASYTEGVRRQGRTPGRSLVTLDRFPCPDALAAETGLTRGEPVWHLERVLLADDERVGLESTYVAEARVPDLDTALTRKAVEELAADGRTVVLTTGFARVTQDATLDALGWRGLVPLTLCPADAGGRGRPYPDMVLEAFLRTKAAEEVAQVAVVGDTSYDMLSGVRAGAGLVAGVRTGAHGDEGLRAAGATHVLDSVAGLPALLRGGGQAGRTT
ncbi:UTRA domain-containing protein [Streptomyces asiaticus]|uniref:UTRA domain-containing protein n=1 Tax=Streptomyces asiaticus TaxID=114695 RepID=UPI00380700B9